MALFKERMQQPSLSQPSQSQPPETDEAFLNDFLDSLEGENDKSIFFYLLLPPTIIYYMK